MPFFSNYQYNKLQFNHSINYPDPRPAALLQTHVKGVKHTWLFTHLSENSGRFTASGLYEEKGHYAEFTKVDLESLSKQYSYLLFDTNFLGAHPISIYKMAADRDILGLRPYWDENDLRRLNISSQFMRSAITEVQKPLRQELLRFDIKDKPIL